MSPNEPATHSSLLLTTPPKLSARDISSAKAKARKNSQARLRSLMLRAKIMNINQRQQNPNHNEITDEKRFMLKHFKHNRQQKITTSNSVRKSKKSAFNIYSARPCENERYG